MMAVAPRRYAGLVASGLSVAVLALGCGDDEPEPSPPPSSSEATQSPTTDPSASDPTTDPTADPTAGSTSAAPTVTPAAGLLLKEKTSQLNVPEGWDKLPDLVSYASSAGSPDSTEIISLNDNESFASPATLDQQVKAHDRTLPDGAIVERQPDVVLDGEPAYYVQWYEKGDSKIQHDFGLDREGRTIIIQMDLDKADAAASQAIVESVLASFSWR